MSGLRSEGWDPLHEQCTAAAGRITCGCRDVCPSGLTDQGSGVRGRRARLSSARKHGRPRIPCSRLLGRVVSHRLPRLAAAKSVANDSSNTIRKFWTASLEQNR
jgi:hypothetical protein